MVRGFGTFATFLFAFACIDALAADRTPADYFEVMTVTPSRQIEHDVELKGPFDDDAIETLLTGPTLFSRAVGFGDMTTEPKPAVFNWYEIKKAKTEPRRVLTVRDTLRADEVYEITIEKRAFLLSPSQQLTSGPPSSTARERGMFQAYEIVNARQQSRKVKLTNTSGPGKRTIKHASFFCVPVEQWHHDDHSTTKNPNHCFMVYELQPHAVKSSVTTLDQFGLNDLETGSSKWLCASAQLVSRSKPRAD